MRRPKTLTAAFCKTISTPGTYGDGRGGFGLTLRVKQTRNDRLSKVWAQRVVIGGKPTYLGLGTYPTVTLAEARRRALKNRREIEAGRDPRGGGIPTFARATDKVIALHRDGWKPGSRTESAWRNGFSRHVYPKLGHRRVDVITTADVLAVLSPMWHKAPRQAEALRRRISQVMRWAIAQGYRPDDAAGPALTAVLPKRTNATTHHRALHHSEVADALRKVRESAVATSTRLAIEFLALTAARTTEVRLATGSEIDHQARVWTVPAERMKAGREHRVSLSSAALRVLDEAYRHTDGELLFPGRRGKPAGHGVLAATFRRLDIGTVHGLRSSFRDWCSETGVPREVAEQALAHSVGGVEGAYARSDLLDLRKPVMEAWGEYVYTEPSR